MPATRPFTMATASGPQVVDAEPMWLILGSAQDKRHKFALHGQTLSDWRSGYKLGDIGWIEAMHYASNPYRRRLGRRGAAQRLVDQTVGRHGVAKVRDVMSAKPALNP